MGPVAAPGAARLDAVEVSSLVRRHPGPRRRLVVGPPGLGHRSHRAVRVRQVDVPAHLEPDARVGARRQAGRRGPSRRRRYLCSGPSPDRRAPPDRHGLPEAESVPGHVHRGQRGRRPGAHQHQDQQVGSRRTVVESNLGPGRSVGRGEGSPIAPGCRPLGWPAAATLCRSGTGGAAKGAVDGRALLGLGPDIDPPDRRHHRRTA